MEVLRQDFYGRRFRHIPRRVRKRRIFHFFFRVLVSLALLASCVYSIYRYCQFEVDGLVVRRPVIFDWKSYLKDTGKDPNLPKPSSEAMIKLMGDLTISQRMKYSPKTEKTIKKCALRGIPDSKLRSMDRKTCQEYYTLQKYITNKSTCFMYTQNKGSVNEIVETLISSDPEFPGVESSITLDEEIFKNVRNFKSFFAATGQKPYGELWARETLDRGPNNEYNHFGFRSHLVQVNRMPPPHMNCTEGHKIELIGKCLHDRIKGAFGQVSPMSISSTGDFTIISAEFLDSGTERAKYDQIHEDCNSKYQYKTDCEEKVIKTVLAEKIGGDGEFVLYTLLSDTESQFTTYTAKTGPYDLWLALMSNVGIFWGASVLGMLPDRKKWEEAQTDMGAWFYNTAATVRAVNIFRRKLRQIRGEQEDELDSFGPGGSMEGSWPPPGGPPGQQSSETNFGPGGAATVINGDQSHVSTNNTIAHIVDNWPRGRTHGVVADIEQGPSDGESSSDETQPQASACNAAARVIDKWPRGTGLESNNGARPKNTTLPKIMDRPSGPSGRRNNDDGVGPSHGGTDSTLVGVFRKRRQTNPGWCRV